MFIIQIALAIVLAVLILVFLKEILALGLILLVVAIAVVAVIAAGAYIYESKADRRQAAQKQNVQMAPVVIPAAAPVSAPMPVKAKKKYQVLVPSDSDSEQIYEIEATNDATVYELQAAASESLRGKVAWLKVTVMPDDANVYADISSVVRLENVVEMPWLMDYQFSIRSPKDHSSVKMQIAHDCSHRQMQILRAHQYHNYMGRSGGGSKFVSQVVGWSSVPTDGSQIEAMWKFACR